MTTTENLVIISDENLTDEMKSYMNRNKYLSMDARHRKIYRCKIKELIGEISRIKITKECGCIFSMPTRPYNNVSYVSEMCESHVKEMRRNVWLRERLQEIDEHIYEIRERYYAKFKKRSRNMDESIVRIKYMYETLNIPRKIDAISDDMREDFIVHKIGPFWHCCSNRVDLYANILEKEDKVCAKARRKYIESKGWSVEEIDEMCKKMGLGYLERKRYIP